MSTDQELLSFVRQVTPAVNDAARLVLADWLEEHAEYKQTPIKYLPEPKDFTRWFYRTVRPRHRGERLRYAPHGGRWDVGRIYTMLNDRFGNWLDRGGFTTIAGQRVLVGELHRSESDAQETAAELHEWLGTPVTYSRPSFYASGRYRFVVWFGLEDQGLPLPADPILA